MCEVRCYYLISTISLWPSLPTLTSTEYVEGEPALQAFTVASLLATTFDLCFSEAWALGLE